MGVAALVTALFVDNMRLRAELGKMALPANDTPIIELAAQQPSQPARRSPQRSSVGAKARSRVAPNPDDAAEIEAQIEAEVDARLEMAVSQRLGKGMDELIEERVEARMDQRHQERRERHRAAMDEHIAEFVSEYELSDEIESRLVTVMDDTMGNLGEIFRSVQSGEVEREDVREEFEELRDEMSTNLIELLGPDAAEAFQEDIRGPLGSRGPRGR